MEKRATLEEKAYQIWKDAHLPEYLHKYGPKRTPGWLIFLSYLEYQEHAKQWRETAYFMIDHYREDRHWTTWQKAISKWPQWVWDAIMKASAKYEGNCKLAGIDGTTFSRSNPSQHYLERIDRKEPVSQPIQSVILADLERRKFLSWRIRSRARGEKCDVPYLIEKCGKELETIIMDKGFDSNPLHVKIREKGIWSIAPVRKRCKKGAYRKEMRDYFDWGIYGQRNIIEAMIGAVKRRYGSFVQACSARMQRAEISMKFVAYNLKARLLVTTFYRAFQEGFKNKIAKGLKPPSCIQES